MSSRPDDDEALAQSEIETLQAELRAALQHERAAVERVQETQREVEALMQRARALLGQSGADGKS